MLKQSPVGGMRSVKHDFADNVLGYVIAIGLSAMLVTPGIWAYQIMYWLKYGEWQPISVADGLHWVGLGEPRFTSLQGVQKISDFVMTLPLSLALFLSILGIVFAFMHWAEGYQKRAKSRQSSS